MQIKHIALFILICTMAAIFRFTGLDWDSGAHLHPDERFLTMVATDMSWPKTITEYFDTNTSPLNPQNVGHNFYVYGTWPVILAKAVAQTFSRDSYDGFPLVGRALSAIADLVTLLFVFLIARHISSSVKQGFLAAFLYAVMVLPIQLSHFFAVDPFATMCMTIALHEIIRKRLGITLGIFVGLALGAKVSSILILPIVFLAFIIQKHPKKILLAMLFCFTCFLTLRISYPYLFDGFALNPKILANWHELKAFDGDNTMFPPALQWIGTTPLLFSLKNLIAWGLGIPMGIIASISILYHLTKINKKHLSILLILIYIGTIFFYQSTQFAKALRYLSPIFPALAILTAIFLNDVCIKKNKYFAYVFIGLFMLWPLSYLSIYTHPHSRIAASEWIYTHIPKRSTIAWEHWDDPLPLARNGHTIYEYTTVQLPMYDPDTDEKWKNITSQLSTTEYIVLSSNRVYGGVAHAKKRYPLTNRYYHMLFSGTLGFIPIQIVTSYPTLFGIPIQDDNAEESFTVYDHPKVIIFYNKKKLSPDTLFQHIIAP